MIKLADTLAPMSNDFYAVESENVGIDIDGTSKSIQQAYEDGDLSSGGSSIQVDTMPIASEYPNEIVQYVGKSGTYQNGYFYQSTSDEKNPPTYSWVQKNVQPNAESFTFNEDDFNVDSSTDKVSLLPSRRVFNGSKADWDLLSVAEKTQYGATAFTDDEGGDFPLTSEAIQLISGVDANLARVIRYGKLVIVALDSITSTSSISQYTVLASRLPVPYTGASEAGQNVASGRITTSTYLYVSNAGTLCVGVGGWDGSRGDGSIVYVTND